MRKYGVRSFKYKYGARVGEEGTLFSVDIVCKDGRQARATFFGDAVKCAVDMLIEGSTYVLASGRWQQAGARSGLGRGACEV